MRGRRWHLVVLVCLATVTAGCGQFGAQQAATAAKPPPFSGTRVTMYGNAKEVLTVYANGTYKQEITGPGVHVVNRNHWTYAATVTNSVEPGPWLVLNKCILPWKYLSGNAGERDARTEMLLISGYGFNGNTNIPYTLPQAPAAASN